MSEFDRLEIAWKVDICPRGQRRNSPNFIFQGLKFNLGFKFQPQEEREKDSFILYIEKVDGQSVVFKDFIINSYVRDTSGKKFFFSTKLIAHPLNLSQQVIWEVNNLTFMSVYDDLVERESGVDKIIINCSLRCETQTSRLEKKPNILSSEIKTQSSDRYSVNDVKEEINMLRSEYLPRMKKNLEIKTQSSDRCSVNDLKEEINMFRSEYLPRMRKNLEIKTQSSDKCSVNDLKEEINMLRSEYLPRIEKDLVCQQDELSNNEEVDGDFNETSCTNYRESATFYRNREPDMVLTCKDLIFPVHRAILAARCKQFLKSIEELDTSEISDMHPSTLEYFLQYVYSGSLRCLSHESICLQLYNSGIKYGLRKLTENCADMLARGPAGGVTVNSFCEFLTLVHKYGDEDTKFKIMSDYNNLKTFLASKEWAKYSKHNADLSIDLSRTILKHLAYAKVIY